MPGGNPNHDAKTGEFSSGGSSGSVSAERPRGEQRSQRAVVGDLHPASKTGKGKDSTIKMEDGSQTPSHIKASMIPPAYQFNLRVSKDPNADVWATSEDKEGNPKRVYNPRFVQANQDVKWDRVGEGVSQMGDIRSQIQNDLRSGSNTKEAAAAWLMSEQATRPGSEEDTKGTKSLWDSPVGKENFVVTGSGDKQKVALIVDGQTFPIKDAGARDEILGRIKTGQSLEDAGYWMKSHGATTLEGRHVVATKTGARLQFMGKEGVWHDHEVSNPKLAEFLLNRKESAGDNGSLFGTNYGATAKYVSQLGGGSFSPKDLRTIRANEIAGSMITNAPIFGNAGERDGYIKDVAVRVSGVLGNRPQQALESYINPALFGSLRVKPT